MTRGSARTRVRAEQTRRQTPGLRREVASRHIEGVAFSGLGKKVPLPEQETGTDSLEQCRRCSCLGHTQSPPDPSPALPRRQHCGGVPEPAANAAAGSTWVDRVGNFQTEDWLCKSGGSIPACHVSSNPATPECPLRDRASRCESAMQEPHYGTSGCRRPFAVYDACRWYRSQTASELCIRGAGFGAQQY